VFEPELDGGIDAGSVTDGGVDAGTQTDGGVDGGTHADGGVDAGVQTDAGVAPRALTAGCGCDTTNLAGFVALIAALRRRPRRTVSLN
jgi:hypothetical protein